MDDEVLGAGMPCGGHMRVFVEPISVSPTLWIMGHGEVAEQLCRSATVLGFVVVVNDPGATADKFPDAQRIVVDDIDYDQLTPEREDYVVIATQHKGDHESVTKALDSDAQYIALIASRKRSGLVLEYLENKNYSKADMQRVIAPCGLDLGARTPVEIALSVMAEIVMLRRQGSGVRLNGTLNDKGKLTAPAGELSASLKEHV